MKRTYILKSNAGMYWNGMLGWRNQFADATMFARKADAEKRRALYSEGQQQNIRVLAVVSQEQSQ